MEDSNLRTIKAAPPSYHPGTPGPQAGGFLLSAATEVQVACEYDDTDHKESHSSTSSSIMNAIASCARLYAS